jgi:hypothetical protein
MNCKHILLPLSLVFLALSCEKSPTGPEPVKDPRTYTWTIDTLAYPGSFQTTMRDIWGSSPNDVYVVGHNDQPGPGTMFHYDGKTWRTTGFHSAEGGSVQGPVSLSAIYGFAPNDVWAVGEHIYTNYNPPPNFLDSSLIIHYDGGKWTEFRPPSGRLLQAVWGSKPNDVWAGGLDGTLYYFDGVTWKAVSIGKKVWFLNFGGFTSSDVYAMAYELDSGVMDSTFQYVWHWDGTTWSIRDFYVETFGNEDKFGTSSLFAVEGNLFSAGQGIFRKSSSGWERIFYDPSTFFRDIKGSGLENLFAVGNFSAVYHFNGSDWYRYRQFLDANIHYSASWTNAKEVFVVGDDGFKTYVLHGK